MNRTYDNKAWSHAGGSDFVEGLAKLEDKCNPCFGYAVQLSASSRVQLQVNCGLEMLGIEQALTVMEDMVRLPSVESLICILRNCRKAKNLVYAKHMHKHICSNGLEVLGNHVILMLVECGDLPEAQQVFNRLDFIDDFSWNSLIQGYAHCGDLQHALDLFQEMQVRCVPCSKGMLVALLKACAKLHCVERGQGIHYEITKEGYERDVFVGSVLVDMYGKCGTLLEAQDVFDELPRRDAVSWTALIAGYGEHGLGDEAFKCLEQMQSDGIRPDVVTFVCILKACGSINMVRNIHTEAAKEGCERDKFVGSTLVHTYAKRGSLAEARDVFGELTVQDVVAWTAIIAGYVEHELGEEALKSFEQMHLEGVCPDASTFVCSLKACGIIGALERGRKIHAEILKGGFDRASFVGNSLVDMYGTCGSLAEAQDMFNKLPIRDVVSWNTLITCFVEHGLGEKALICLEQMQSEMCGVAAVTFICCLKACGSIGAIEKGCTLHSELVNYGFDFNDFLGNALVDMYAKCGALAEAQEMFNKLPACDVVSWNSLIAGYAKHGHGQEALNHFHKMQLEAISPDIVSWNSVIIGCAEEGEREKANAYFSLMQEQGLMPDHVTFVSNLKACRNTTALETGKRLHTQIFRHGGLEVNDELTVTNALMDMYGSCGSMVDAQRLFNVARTRDLVTWNALITGYARQGEIESALHHFERMVEAGIKPGEITFVSVLTACSHAGLRDRGEKYFEVMNNVYGITPTISHHNCMVDLLGRAGQLDEAVAMLEKLPLKPDLVTWNAMLGACLKWGDVKLEKVVFECALRVNGKHADFSVEHIQHTYLSRIRESREAWNGSLLAMSDHHAHRGDV